jgi:hypothetical protein
MRGWGGGGESHVTHTWPHGDPAVSSMTDVSPWIFIAAEHHSCTTIALLLQHYHLHRIQRAVHQLIVAWKSSRYALVLANQLQMLNLAWYELHHFEALA